MRYFYFLLTNINSKFHPLKSNKLKMNKLLLKTILRCQYCTTKNKCKSKTAGIIVIGDEILNGDVTDANSPIITKEFRRLGIQVKKISVIGDEIDEISNEVQIFSKLYHYVLTSGGIGPTHDDITFEAIAKAFHKPLVLNAELQKLCEKFYKTTDLNHPGMKLAYIPETAKLNFVNMMFDRKVRYPSVSINNVFIFPGIPELFCKLFLNLSSEIFKSEDKFYGDCIYFNVTEDVIVTALNSLVNDYPNVKFGSYPKLYDSKYKVKVTVQSTDQEMMVAACKKLTDMIPTEFVVFTDKEGNLS